MSNIINESKKDDFEKWSALKTNIHFAVEVRRLLFKAREIWWASIGVNIGHEEDGKNFRYERPILIIKKFNQHLVLVIPLSSRLKDNIYYYRFIFENIPRTAIISQIRIISSKRLIRRMGRLNSDSFKLIIGEIKNFL